MAYLGDFRLGDTLDFHFTTRQISGAPSTLSSSPVLSCYVGNSTTEITAGITLDVDFDSRTGLNHVRIVATGGNGYATASNYSVVITTGTVNSVSVVGEVIGNFSIEARSAVMPTTAARTLDVSATGEAGVDWANIGSPTTAVNLSATNIDVDQVVASVSGAVGSVTGAVGSVTGAVGSVTGNVGGNVVGSVGSVTGAVGSVTGAVGSVTGNVGGNVVGTVAGVTPAIAGDAMALTSAERNSTADALLARNVSGGSSAGRTVKQALHVLRNKTDIAAGTLTVYDTDDTTASFTAAVTTTAGDPISQIDPA